MGTTANGLPQRPRAPEGSQLFPVPYICSRARCGQSETPLSGPLCPFLNALAGISITQSVGGGMLSPLANGLPLLLGQLPRCLSHGEGHQGEVLYLAF